MCAGACGSFVCENNVCVVGTRGDAGIDAGEGRLPDGGLVDGGHVPGWIHDGDAGKEPRGNDAGSPAGSDAGSRGDPETIDGGQSDAPASSGCSTAPALMAAIAVFAVVRRRATVSRGGEP